MFAPPALATLPAVRALLLLLLALPAWAARPVARPLKGPLEKWEVSRDSFGVVLTFAPDSKKQAAQQVVEALAHGGGFQPGQLQAAFLKTPKARLVALLVTRPGFTIGKLMDLARDASAENGVGDAYAFFHPGPTDEDIELEAFWHYKNGELADASRQNFRDATEYVAWVRRRGSEQALERAAQSWPLAKLALQLGIPGRDPFVHPWGLEDWAVSGWPTDVGDDLVRLPVQVPDALAMEIRQQAELRKVSVSKAVRDALAAASTEGKLGEQPGSEVRAPYDEGGKEAARAAPKELVLYLDRDTYWALEGAAETHSLSPGHVVQYAWRRGHAFSAR